MAVRRKRAKRRSKRISAKLSTARRKRALRISYRPSLTGILKVLVLVVIPAGVVAGFIFLDKYVKKTVPVSEKTGYVELVGAPEWVSEPLKGKIYDAAVANGEDLKLDEDAASSVQQNIETLVVWVDDVKVQTTHDSICIEANWRKPLGLVKSGLHKFYVDAQLVVLDFVPLPDLPIVMVKGLTVTKKPRPGDIWQRDDLAAAIAVLDRLDQMDRRVTPDKPLLYEIASIDVSNFNGRQNTGHPHIVLYAKDNTEIVWGAEIDKWQRHLESTDAEKIAKFYSYYKKYGTVQGVKYINLREPQEPIPQPIDKY